jgi:hypothetical protein
LLKRHFNYTEEEICNNIELYGMDWVYSAYKVAKEQEYTDRVWNLNVSQTIQSPQTKEGARKLQSYVKKLYSAAESQVPWIVDKREASKKAKVSSRDLEIRQRATRPLDSKVILEGVEGMPEDAKQLFQGLSQVHVQQQ